jgi:hypothetical protein
MYFYLTNFQIQDKISTAKILGINFIQVNPKQVDFIVNVTESNDKYNIEIGK